MSTFYPQIATFAPVPRREDVGRFHEFFSVPRIIGQSVPQHSCYRRHALWEVFEMGLHGLDFASLSCVIPFLPRFLEQDIPEPRLACRPHTLGILHCVHVASGPRQLAAARDARGVTDAVLLPAMGIAARRRPPTAS